MAKISKSLKKDVCIGRKFDSGKPRWSLLLWESVKQIVHVLTFGSQKYEDHNWKKVDNPIDRYYSAMMRHITDWYTGEKYDPETGYSHLAHAGCCLLFLLWFELKEIGDVSPRVKAGTEKLKSTFVHETNDK